MVNFTDRGSMSEGRWSSVPTRPDPKRLSTVDRSGFRIPPRPNSKRELGSQEGAIEENPIDELGALKLELAKRDRDLITISEQLSLTRSDMIHSLRILSGLNLSQTELNISSISIVAQSVHVRNGAQALLDAVAHKFRAKW